MILREDSYWFQDFQLKKLLRIGEGAPKNDEIIGSGVVQALGWMAPSCLTPLLEPFKREYT